LREIMRLTFKCRCFNCICLCKIFFCNIYK